MEACSEGVMAYVIGDTAGQKNPRSFYKKERLGWEEAGNVDKVSNTSLRRKLDLHLTY